LRSGAATRLPAHLRPSRYVRVDALPLSSNGKVDRSVLVEPVDSLTDTRLSPALTLEDRVTAIVRGVLRRPIGREDDFFAMGGDSLGAVDVVLALERETGRRLPPSLLLGAPTVRGIVEALGDDPRESRTAVVTAAAGGPGTTLVLVPSHYGHPLAYATLARHLDGVRPVLMSDVSRVGLDGAVGSFDSIARRHVDGLLASRPSGPYLLGGFCFGGAMAYEMARQLIETGHPPAGLYLLGVSPYDVPDLVVPADVRRWEASITPAGMLRRAFHFGRGLVGPVGRAYLADRARHQARWVAALASAEGRERFRARGRRNATMHPAVGRYRGPALPIPVTLILPAWSLATYADDPVALWEGAGSRVEVRVVPGVERMMLREPVVTEVARILATDPPA
jgi:thioesterase domain-containing protein/acyl carrier protein